jgi:hypothetical protein
VDLTVEDVLSLREFDISREILAYLVDHPGAQDTLDGILHWWLLEREIKFQTEKVKGALGNLVKKGLILKYKSGDSRIHYRINQTKYDEIQELLKQT